MDNILLYFIKSGIAMALFYGIYRLFLEKETNYTLNRYYLVGTLILSLVLPVLPVEKLFTIERYVGMPVIFIGTEEQAAAGTGVVSGESAEMQITGLMLARLIYFCGIGVLVATLLLQLFRLIFIPRCGQDFYGPLKVIFVKKDINPFSILNRVFISEDVLGNPSYRTILDHEYAHYRFLHFIDLLILEFITIFQWFNPLTWLYVRSLKEIHEYQADAVVLHNGESAGRYQALLVNQLTGTEVFRLANGFSKSLTKKRMIMMTKMRSKRGAWLKALLAVPVLTVLLLVYAAKPSSGVQDDGEYYVKGQVVEAETGDPLPGVNVIWKGTTTGTATDMDGNFSLKVKDKDAVVTYSFVGFETAITKGAGEYTVKMKKKLFKITGEWEEPPSGEEGAESKDPGKETETFDKEIFFVVEDMPKFQGKSHFASRKYVQEILEYPAEAKEKGIQGIVQVQFLVNSKGEVKDATVVRGVDPALDKAALKAVYSMPVWTPGRQRGKPVAVQFVIPVEFSLGEK